MKKYYTFLFSLLLPFFLQAAINPSEKASLFEHLNEVNKEWSKQENAVVSLNEIVDFKEDKDRIQLHLRLVENILRNRQTPNLSFEQKAKRIQQLDVLKIYWQAGIFPQNIYHFNRQPYFVDHLGTACAVGHLVRESGASDLVKLIEKKDNFAYIEELKKYEELIDWAVENGFSLEELAWIQPGYPPSEKVINQIGNGGGANGEITLIKSNGLDLYFAGDFTEIDGFSAQGIARWNNEEWSTVGDGLIGEINDIEFFNGNGEIIVQGDFEIVGTGEQAKLAIFNSDENSWNVILDDLWEGEIRDVQPVYSFQNNVILVGGLFNSIEEISYKNLAFYNIENEEWLSEVYGCNIGTNGAINSFYRLNENIYLGGEFSEVYESCNTLTDTLTTNNLAVFNQNTFELIEQPFFNSFSKLEKINVHNGIIWGYEHTSDATYLHALYGGIWHSNMYRSVINFNSPATFLGFTSYSYDASVYIFGDFSNVPPDDISIGVFGNGIAGIYSGGFTTSLGAVIEPNGKITAADYYKGEIYFAGDFTQIQGETYNGMASSNFQGSTSVEPNPTNLAEEITTFQENENMVILRYRDLEQDAQIAFHSIDGKLIYQGTLSSGSGQMEIDFSAVNSGIYFYSLNNSEGQIGDKFVFVR